MSLIVRWSFQALAELDALDTYFADKAPDHADRVGDAAIAAANFLTELPLAGEKIAKTDQRKWAVPNTRYILLYRPEPEILRILHVIHAARDWTRFI
jgi:toxin ParE1/3/4